MSLYIYKYEQKELDRLKSIFVKDNEEYKLLLNDYYTAKWKWYQMSIDALSNWINVLHICHLRGLTKIYYQTTPFNLDGLDGVPIPENLDISKLDAAQITIIAKLAQEQGSEFIPDARLVTGKYGAGDYSNMTIGANKKLAIEIPKVTYRVLPGYLIRSLGVIMYIMGQFKGFNDRDKNKFDKTTTGFYKAIQDCKKAVDIEETFQDLRSKLIILLEKRNQSWLKYHYYAIGMIDERTLVATKIEEATKKLNDSDKYIKEFVDKKKKILEDKYKKELENEKLLADQKSKNRSIISLISFILILFTGIFSYFKFKK